MGSVNRARPCVNLVSDVQIFRQQHSGPMFVRELRFSFCSFEEGRDCSFQNIGGKYQINGSLAVLNMANLILELPLQG